MGFRFANELCGFGNLVDVRALIHQTITRRRQRLRHVQLFQDHMRGILDVGRPRSAGHRLADGFADDLVGLIGILDRGRIFHGILEQRHLLDELDAATAHSLLGHAGTLPAEEDDRRIFHQRALHGRSGIGNAGAEGADADGGFAGNARCRLRHEPCGRLVVRSDHRPAALLCFQEHVHEVRVRDAEERVDAFGFKELQDTLIDFYGHLISPVNDCRRAQEGALTGTKSGQAL